MNDMLYQFPCERLRGYHKIVLFGAGRVGTDYYYQIQRAGVHKIAAWVDSYPCRGGIHPSVETLDEGLRRESDIWVIAVAIREMAGEIKELLKSRGVDERRIFWEEPAAISVRSLMDRDDFLGRLKDWKSHRWENGKEDLWELGKDVEVLVQDYKKVLNTGSYDRRDWYVNQEKKIAYLNVAKAACTSIIANLSCKRIQANYQEIHDTLDPALRYDGPQENLASFFKFTYVRNPFSRLVSCYRNKYHTDQALVGSQSEKLYFGQSRYLMGYLKEDLGFPEFVRRVSRIPERWQDRHFRSQYDLLYREGQCLVKFVGRFEELPRSYASIRGRFDLPPLDHHNDSRNSDWENNYDEETANLVYEKYKQDIVVFGYEGEYERLMREIERRRKRTW